MTTPVPELQLAREHLQNPTISPADWAALIETSVGNVYKGLHDGEVPAIRLGYRFRIPSAWARQQLGLD